MTKVRKIQTTYWIKDGKVVTPKITDDTPVSSITTITAESKLDKEPVVKIGEQKVDLSNIKPPVATAEDIDELTSKNIRKVLEDMKEADHKKEIERITSVYNRLIGKVVAQNNQLKDRIAELEKAEVVKFAFETEQLSKTEELHHPWMGKEGDPVMADFNVSRLPGGVYTVIHKKDGECWFKGNLSDCYAWLNIRCIFHQTKI